MNCWFADSDFETLIWECWWICKLIRLLMLWFLAKFNQIFFYAFIYFQNVGTTGYSLKSIIYSLKDQQGRKREALAVGRVRIVKNELGGSATQQELRGWGSQWNEQVNWGLNPPTPVNSNLRSWPTYSVRSKYSRTYKLNTAHAKTPKFELISYHPIRPTQTNYTGFLSNA